MFPHIPFPQVLYISLPSSFHYYNLLYEKVEYSFAKVFAPKLLTKISFEKRSLNPHIIWVYSIYIKETLLFVIQNSIKYYFAQLLNYVSLYLSDYTDSLSSTFNDF